MRKLILGVLLAFSSNAHAGDLSFTEICEIELASSIVRGNYLVYVKHKNPEWVAHQAREICSRIGYNEGRNDE